MNVRGGLALLALLALPACLSPIVGTECAAGYSPCHGACMATGSCVAADGAIAEDAPTLDAGVVDARTAPDSASAEAAVLVDASMEGATRGQDVQEPDAFVTDDAPLLPDDTEPESVIPDGATADDVPMQDGSGGPIFAIDAAIAPNDASADAGDDGSACSGCLDAGYDVESDGATVDGNTAAALADDAAGAVDAGPLAVDGPLVCTGQQAICTDQCVDLTSDPENCGDCSILCSSGVCTDSTCLVCAAEESVCGRQCANTATDPDNCGDCSIPCASGLCSNGQCEANGTGRVIVIGHDYLNNRPAMNRILGNAVFLWPTNPVRLVVYEGAANPSAIAGADGAINQVATATGRLAQRVAVVAADVTTQLSTADVFLIYGQEQASDDDLTQLGQDWMSALHDFVDAGGTVVLLDGAYAANSGTCQILSQANLFQIAHNGSSTGDVCTVVARGDALATGLPKTYLCEKNSVNFTMTDPAPTITTVVEDAGQIVVVHKIF
jgi:hypothetical protein